MFDQIRESIRQYIAIEIKAADIFVCIKHNMTYEEVQSRIGTPKNKGRILDKTTGVWEINDNVITIEFLNNKVYSKTLKRKKTGIMIKRNHWEAKEGRTSMITITED